MRLKYLLVTEYLKNKKALANEKYLLIKLNYLNNLKKTRKIFI